MPRQGLFDERYGGEIERESTPDGTDFYENWGDNGSEFVSGLIEAFIIDRFTGSTVQSNDRLDADENTVNGYNSYTHKSTISGNGNDYISCKEAYNFMKLFHLGFRLNRDPWIDSPQFEPTNLEQGNNYLF